MPSSKLDYLSKYTSTTSDYDVESNKEKKKKDRKKTKKKKKSSTQHQLAVKTTTTTALHDDSDDQGLPFYKSNKNNFSGDDDDDDDDRPMIGDDDEEGPVVVNSGDVDVMGGDSAPLASLSSTVTKTLGVRQEIDLETGAVTTISDRQARRRHDSDDESSLDRKRGRRQRYDSSPEQSHGDRQATLRRRHDSDDDSSEDADRRKESAASKHKRQRHDSDVDEADALGKQKKLSGRHRHDSDEGSEGERQKPDIVRSTNRRHRRHDSDNESSEADRKPDPVRSSTNRRRRHDSDEDWSDDDEPKPDRSSSKRQRHDSNSDDSEPDADIDDARAQMSSGHKAGLQHYNDFNKTEKKIQQRKHSEAQQMVDKYGMGATVYRDQHGRKTDQTQEKGGSRGSSRKEVDAETQRRLNQGKKQQQVMEAKAQEMAILQESSFARHQDDDRLEALRKNEIRKEDPMAHYEAKKQKKTAPIGAGGGGTLLEPSKPMYKGPPPKPNRYGIRPGYRWDGIDRGNDFEDKVLAQKYSTKQKEEQAYRWRSADM